MKPFPLGEAINNGMSEYFINIKEKFDKLVEISLVGRSKYVQMVYVESVNRDMQE